uniref:Cell cycle checkpoint control protein RAD9A n=1 Tax=Lepeophtheirus salmonis TaxID=72036 RepID=A0A0K2V6S5_LEPSM
MKCIVSGNNVKVIGRTMHCLSKIGDDIYLDPGGEGLALIAFNTSKSAYLRYFFSDNFFESYNSGGKMSKDCVSVKGILMAFRSLFVLEKTVESCRMEMLQNDLKITLFCKHSVKKSYVLPFIDYEPLNTQVELFGQSNQFLVKSKTFSEAVINFLTNQEEVTMYVDESRFMMKNFNDVNEKMIKKLKNKTKIESNSVYTELTLKPDEFEEYSIDNASELTFCLRELRPFIGFAESLACLVSVKFESGGSPIMFEIDGNPSFKSKMVLSTSKHSLRSDYDDPRASQRSIDTLTDQRSQLVSNDSISMKRKTSTPFMNTPLENTSKCTPLSHLNISGINNDDPPISESPPSKKIKYFFKRCFNKTFNPSNITGAQVVLAPDSDDENELDINS